ncbi:MAG: HSP20 family protein [Parcubacteria group bacterium Gr01-1014_73]|nr:MAG: HSP20 family protein [Parcubacteria group bacterium Gr01-1014_73]
MAKEKRSFFERLTGAVNVPAESEEREVNVAATDEKLSEWLEEENGDGQLAVDVYQTPDDIFIRAMVAGVKAEDLDISITRDMVTIKGLREGSQEISEENFFFKELYWGSFSRTILLPQEVEVEEAEASEKNGLLTIRLPKVDKGRQTKLRVKSS